MQLHDDVKGSLADVHAECDSLIDNEAFRDEAERQDRDETFETLGFEHLDEHEDGKEVVNLKLIVVGASN